MSEVPLVDAIRSFIIRTFPLARGRRLEVDAPLLTSGIVDSLGVLTIVEFVQRHFAVELLDDDLTADNFGSIGRLASLIASRRAIAAEDNGAGHPTR
jgi:acyl carrier protein